MRAPCKLNLRVQIPEGTGANRAGWHPFLPGFGDFQRGGRQGTYSQVAPCKLNLRVQILEGKSSSSDGTLSFRDDGQRFQRLEVFPVGETGACGAGAAQRP